MQVLNWPPSMSSTSYPFFLVVCLACGSLSQNGRKREKTRTSTTSTDPFLKTSVHPSTWLLRPLLVEPTTAPSPHHPAHSRRDATSVKDIATNVLGRACCSLARFSPIRRSPSGPPLKPRGRGRAACEIARQNLGPQMSRCEPAGFGFFMRLS